MVIRVTILKMMMTQMKKILGKERKIKPNLLKENQNIQKRKIINQKNPKENKFSFFFYIKQNYHLIPYQVIIKFEYML